MIVQVSTAVRCNKNPRLFEIAGEDGKFFAADAEVSGSVIHVSSSAVNRPRTVRYAWVNYGEVDVFGENGLPLAPFCLR